MSIAVSHQRNSSPRPESESKSAASCTRCEGFICVSAEESLVVVVDLLLPCFEDSFSLEEGSMMRDVPGDDKDFVCLVAEHAPSATLQ